MGNCRMEWLLWQNGLVVLFQALWVIINVGSVFVRTGIKKLGETMIPNKRKLTSAVLAIALAANQCAFAKTVLKAQTGAERAKQYAKVIADCQKRNGGVRDVSAEWAGHYGRTGWWP